MKSTVLQKIRKSKSAKIISLSLLCSFACQMVAPLQSYALTSGPAQPETEGFMPVDATNMVSPFTGDFSYNIPLMEIGGYPINLGYQSGVTMEQEATWTGLGWNVNIGSITRQMRGVPDEFWEDEITKEFNMKDNFTVGANVGVSGEAFGFDVGGGAQVGLSMGVDISYNNYKGFNLGTSFAPSIGTKKGAAFGTNFSLGMSSSLDGMNISPNLSFSKSMASMGDNNMKATLGFGLNMNSRTGLSNLTLSHGVRFESNLSYYGLNLKDYGLTDEGSSSKSIFGGSISFAGRSYMPQIDFPFESGAFTGTFKIGAAAWGGDFDLKVGGYGSLQRLKQKKIKTPAYGYFYEEKANGKDEAIMDFNREKDGAFTETTPALPITIHTFDIFSINAHGLSGSFRGFRNDVGFVHDNRMKTTSFDFTTGFELNSAGLLDVGFDIAANTVLSESKAWRQQNKAEQHLQAREKKPNEIKENFHLKIVGEPSALVDASYESRTGNDMATYIPFEGTASNFGTKLDNKFKFKNGSSQDINQAIYKDKRESRNVSISYMTVKDVKNVSPRRAKYLSPHAQNHHIAEITVVHPDGKRYVFGLAAYNKEQKDVTFSVGAGKYGNPTSVVPQGEGFNPPYVDNITQTDASIGNKMGIDNFFEATTTPAYVHSWFLTEVYSPDYVDITGDGPTVDDIGNYVVFNYGNIGAGGKITPDVPNFMWRTPSGAPNTASFNKGLYSDPTDDKANYIYGVKEMYFLHNIQSKNQVAAFELVDREDGFGVTGELGGPGGQALKAIKSISLYSREEYASSMVPSKTVHFEYDYSLCEHTPNSFTSVTNPERGKLTLKKVWFSYQNSARSKFSHYSFDYNNNKRYDSNRPTDRWGNYKTNVTVLTTGPDNSEFPYVTQNSQNEKEKLRDDAATWGLSKIGLPTGGSITVEYEPDDYSHVQDRKAARMFKVISAGKDKDSYVPGNDRLFKKELTGSNFGVTNYNYLFFDLEKDTEGWNDAKIREKYLPKTYSQPETYIYYRFFANVNNGNEYANATGPADKKKEYISGYAEVDMADPDYMGRIPNTNTGYIKIKAVPVSDKPGGPGAAISINPIAKAAWQFSRIYTPKYAFNQPDPDDSDFEVIIKMLAASDLVSQMINMFKGPNIRMLEKGFGAYFDTKRSWIRLNDPDGQKFGGGSRVKSVTVADNWNDMESTEASSSYTQEFHYKMDDGTSSGVASYEPMMGADENPFREPVFFPGKKNLIIPGDGFYQETPYGESFFPSPTVGYRRVITKDKPVSGSSNSATGVTVQEFYTAKEYPTITDKTVIDNRRKKTNPLFALLKIDVRDYMPVSQGFIVELNDMHGKPKSKKTYAQTDSENPTKLISSEEYVYFDQAYDGEKRRLYNDIPVIDDKGRIAEKRLGTEYDIVVDMREQKTRVYNVSVAANIAYFQIGFIPTLVPTVFPGFSTETTMFRSAVTTKVISKYAVLKETIVTDLGSRISKKNIAFDPITGDPLLVQVDSEFEDHQYSLTMPARWMYSGMGPAYQNIGFTFSASLNINSSGAIIINSPADLHLHPGDELLFNPDGRRGQMPSMGNEHAYRFWVARDDGTNTKYLINAIGSGIAIQSGIDGLFTVIRSGHRNMNAVPAQVASSLVSPTNTTGTVIELNTAKKILSSSASFFGEQWAVNSFNSEEKCEVICELDDKGKTYIGWLNQMLAQGLLGDGNTYPLANFTNAYENVVYCSQSSNITTEFVGTPAELRVSIAGCDMLCHTVTFPDIGSHEQLDHIDHLSTYRTMKLPDCSTPRDEGSERDVASFEIFAVGDDGSITSITSSTNCFRYDCSRITRNFCLTYGNPINPYTKGILGNWRPEAEIAYITTRANQDLTAPADVRGGGYYTSYTPLWKIPVSSGDQWTITPQTSGENFWQWVSRITAYGISGADVENMNALPAYSAALYGYYNLLPTAVGNNTRYREMAMDGFEDYYSQATTGVCYKDHFRFEDNVNAVVSEASHTGKYSLKVPAQTTYKVVRPISPPHTGRGTRDVPYILQQGDFLGLYSPPANTANYKFIISFWAKPADYLPEEFDYANIGMTFTLGANDYTVTPVKTKRVEGWQKFEFVYTLNIPATGNVEVKLNNNRSGAVYFDDLRIHPFDANIKTYVYDLNTLKTMAELDNNNFATFYEYDEDGGLVRIKKETEKGIVTLKEDRKSNVKKPIN